MAQTAARTDVDDPATNTPRGGPRAEQIARAATRLFQEQGYQNVSIDQIGAAVGLTGPAVYRHFKGKYGILVHALMTQTDRVDALYDQAERSDSSMADQLTLILSGLSDLTANGDEATLYRREQRHLLAEERETFRAHFVDKSHRIAERIAAAHPETSEDKADLLGFVILTLFSNTPTIRGSLSPERLVEIQSALADAIITCTLPDPAVDAEPTPVLHYRRPAGRRERILEASAELFDERGFYDVRIDEIAKASEMSVATLYQLVAGKTQVLSAILRRGAEGLLYVTANALARATTPEQALDALIRTYIHQALGVHGRIMRILATDLLYLPEEDQASLRSTQREYVAEWIEAICARAPHLSPADARALAHAVIGVITDVSQTSPWRERPEVADELTALAHAMVVPAALEPT